MRRLAPIAIGLALVSTGACSKSPTTPSSGSFRYGPFILKCLLESAYTRCTATATLFPYDDVTSEAVWLSSNPRVATADGGIIRAVGTGNATISASYAGQTSPWPVRVLPGDIPRTLHRLTIFAADKDAFEARQIRYLSGVVVTVVAGVNTGRVATPIGDSPFYAMDDLLDGPITLRLRKAGYADAEVSGECLGFCSGLPPGTALMTKE